MIEYNCVICGSPVYAPAKMNGCKMFCETCEEDEQLMEWYRNRPPVKGARQLHWEATHGTETGV